MTDRSPPRAAPKSVCEPPFEPSGRFRDANARVGGLLLAAGTSSRFGDRNKLLAKHDGEPIVKLAAQTLLEAALDPIVIVVGYEADRIREAISELSVETVYNEAYDSGQASSLQVGVTALRDCESLDAIVVALGDMPFVGPETIETLIEAYEKGVGDAIAAAYDGTRGNPVLFDRRFFDSLASVDGDVGGRQILLDCDAAVMVEVDDPGVLRDVDVPDDL